MRYKEALEYVHSIPKFQKPLGNANLQRLLECLGTPQEKLKFIHIAGTNGKGSTAAMIASALHAQGYKTGLYTSPYIEVFNERIQINGANISDGALSEYIWYVKDTMEKSDTPVSEFAFITAVAFSYFENAGCDYVVLEAGMGGRCDATNVIDESVVSVITSIGLDHMQYLGDTPEQIAIEKCGIIKDCGTVVSHPNRRVMPVIEEECHKRRASLRVARAAELEDDGVVYDGVYYPLSLKGGYQAQNAAVALETLFALREKGVKITYNAICGGFASVRWPARFEFVRGNVVIDGAHNIDGIEALKSSLTALHKNIIIVMAMMEDKSFKPCVETIAPAARLFIATELKTPRCLRAKRLAETARSVKADTIVEADIEKALELALKYVGEDEIVCVCGSLYLAGEARRILKPARENQ